MFKLRMAASAGLLVMVAVPAAAQHMNAETFYQRAMKLKAKGPLAIFSRRELKALIAEVQAAGTQVKETRLAAERSGHHGRYCPPVKKHEMGHEEYLKGIGAIPQSERRKIDMVEATTRMLAAKFPCAK